MSRYLTPLYMQPLDSGRLWRILSPLVYESDVLGITITVPAGFVCDLNSMPRLTWIVAPKTDYPEAGTLHDWGYRGNLPRKDADLLYREALGVEAFGETNGVLSERRRRNRYYALRLVGWFAYKGKK